MIAQEALEDRAASRMLVVYREEGRWEDRQFRELPSFLRAGDCLVLKFTSSAMDYRPELWAEDEQMALFPLT